MGSHGRILKREDMIRSEFLKRQDGCRVSDRLERERDKLVGETLRYGEG